LSAADEATTVTTARKVGPEDIHESLRPDETQSISTLFSLLEGVFPNSKMHGLSTSQMPPSPAILIEKLEHMGLNPRVASNSNASTGNFTMIRTQDALPGTRYFHAQFMADQDGGNTVAQHISFEIRPGKDAMETAVKMAEETFGLTNTIPAAHNANYIEWNRNGKTLWIKRITDTKELKSDLWNAREPEDTGVVMIALELDPHAHEKE
jgi:hypothetical protein